MTQSSTPTADKYFGTPEPPLAQVAAGASGGAPEPLSEVTLQCQEVWGGNGRVERRVRLTGLDAWVLCEPCERGAAGGDVHYVSACAGRQYARILVADVSGHGAAAVNTAEALRSIMARVVNDRDQRRLVQHLNEEFTVANAELRARNGGEPFRFATAVALTFDSGTNRLQVCNAGHPPPLWYRSATRRWASLAPVETERQGNFPVGIFDGADYEQFELDLEQGDWVVCYTDSLTEARDSAGEMLGVEGLLALVRNVTKSDPAGIRSDLIPALGRLDARNLTQDDITCLSLRVTDTCVRRPRGAEQPDDMLRWDVEQQSTDAHL